MAITKKIVSTSLALVLSVGMIPQVSYADNGDVSKNSQSSKKANVSSVLNQADDPRALLEKMTEYGNRAFLSEVTGLDYYTLASVKNNLRSEADALDKLIAGLFDRVEKTTNANELRKLKDVKKYQNEVNKIKKQCEDFEKLLSSDQRKKEIAQEIAKSLYSTFEDDRIEALIGAIDKAVYSNYTFANGPAYETRDQFRKIVAAMFLYGELTAFPLAYNRDDSSDSDMNTLDNYVKKLNNVLNKNCVLNSGDVEKFNDDGYRFVYCYPTQCFVSLRDGNRWGGWKGALRSNYNDYKISNNNHYVDVGFYDKDCVKSPFGDLWKINTFSEERSLPFSTQYLDSADLIKVSFSIPSGSTIYDEFNAHKLNIKNDGSVLYDEHNLKGNGKLVGGESFVHNNYSDTHTWSMDYITTTGPKGSIPKMNEIVFKSNTVKFYTEAKKDIKLGKKEKPRTEHVIKTLVDPATLFVLYKG